jgi:hypothetical protein
MSSVPLPTRVNHVDLYNLREVIGQDAEAVMVYGTVGCSYKEVHEGAERLIPASIPSTITDNSKSPKPLRKVYDYSVGIRGSNPRSVDGRTSIPQINYTETTFSTKEISRQCKAGVTNLTIFNTILEAQRQPTIPTIFCVEGSKVDPSLNCTWHITDETILSKEPVLNDKVTMKEARRVGKLCFDERIDERVRTTARTNFHFVSVTEKLDYDEQTNTNHYTYLLTKISPPWGKTTESIKAFKNGLETRASEKEAAPLSRVFRRIPATQNGDFYKRRIKDATTAKLERATQAEGLTKEEESDFEKNFNWDTAFNSNRVFTFRNGEHPKTLKQAYSDALNEEMATPSFRTQVNELVEDTLDVGTIIVPKPIGLQQAQEEPTTTTETEITQPIILQQQEIAVEV